MPARTWSETELIEAVKNSTSWKDVATRLNISASSQSGVYRVKSIADELGLDYSHFIRKTKKGYRKFKTVDIFRDGCTFQTTHRRYFLELVEYKCVTCGISEWQGLPITLQVDHIDGNDRNNTLENLRLLCPNCHAQTDTWGVQKRFRAS